MIDRVNVFGHLSHLSGVRQAAQNTIDAIKTTCMKVDAFDIANLPTSSEYSLHSIFHTALYENVKARENAYNIAVCYWETEDFPFSWLDKIQSYNVNEIWAPTTFIRNSVLKSCRQRNLEIPIIKMLPGIRVYDEMETDRSTYGFSADHFVFLFMFDCSSYIGRKNPLGLIEAFKRAFKSDDRTALIIKVLNASNYAMARVLHAATGANIKVINAKLSIEATHSLIKMADCYISLHKSEGFGLTLAEAMWLGTPTIATNYSGNCDFMTDDLSFLVDVARMEDCSSYLSFYHGNCPTTSWATPPHSRKPLTGQGWAVPSIEHAAHLMRLVYEDTDMAKSKALRAKESVRSQLSLESYGNRITSRLGTLS